VSSADSSERPGWRVAPANVTLAHLRRMDLRQPHLVAEVDGLLLLAAIPDRSRWTLGRAAECNLQIDWDPTVSRVHANVERLGNLLVLEDSGVSRNGTFVGGKRAIGRTRLHDLDEFRLGHTTLLVRVPASVTSTAATVTIRQRGRSEPVNLDLTPKEAQVVIALLPKAGDDDAPVPIPTNREIAAQLDIGVETVKTHLKSIARKIAASGVRGAIDRGRIAELAAAGDLALPFDGELESG
jgi:pSer/pThr/pTyr-binding forkhead associated (FHA) protein